ncbi:MULTISPECIES: type VI secretion system tube protein Hcp [unclassified Paraburkholderia]|uniref:Hcp family type VI secretion system effector n=1 Tax=unclassified Paraburkholderia TaxID=2615204 RepID=UPI000E28A1E3|nr:MULTISPECIES: type VI secretion system tube protein Hcp [unclassified Paraburkholderia]REE22513.1 type VI secretion system secreted protein Hcp [Paraburkholderia sp. BL27I4N3]RKR36704.1 type VI secretion system secreted protein Hcp [Paraburkholderia sp. BL17N1]
MAQDIFININGISGESQDFEHLDEIDVQSWSWQVAQNSSMLSGSGGGAGKASVSDLGFFHAYDRASPNLAKYCFTGKHIEKAVLTMRKAGTVPHEFARITMYDVVITNVSPVANGSICHEHVTLSFATMKHEYILQNPLGGSGGVVTAMMYIKENSTVK